MEATRKHCGDYDGCSTRRPPPRPSAYFAENSRDGGKNSRRQTGDRRSASIPTDVSNSNPRDLSMVARRTQGDPERLRYIYESKVNHGRGSRSRSSPESSSTSETEESSLIDADFHADLSRVRRKLTEKVVEAKSRLNNVKSPDLSMANVSEEISLSSVDHQKGQEINSLPRKSSKVWLKEWMDDINNETKNKHNSKSQPSDEFRVFTNKTVSAQVLDILDGINRDALLSGSEEKSKGYLETDLEIRPSKSKSLTEVESDEAFKKEFNFPDGKCSILYVDDRSGRPLYRVVNHFRHKTITPPKIDSEESIAPKLDKSVIRELGVSTKNSSRGLVSDSRRPDDFRSKNDVTVRSSGVSDLGNVREKSTSSQIGLSPSLSSSVSPGIRNWKSTSSSRQLDRTSLISTSYDHGTIRDMMNRRSESGREKSSSGHSSGMLSRRQSVAEAMDEILWYRPKKTKSFTR